MFRTQWIQSYRRLLLTNIALISRPFSVPALSSVSNKHGSTVLSNWTTCLSAVIMPQSESINTRVLLMVNWLLFSSRPSVTCCLHRVLKFDTVEIRGVELDFAISKNTHSPMLHWRDLVSAKLFVFNNRLHDLFYRRLNVTSDWRHSLSEL